MASDPYPIIMYALNVSGMKYPIALLVFLFYSWHTPLYSQQTAVFTAAGQLFEKGLSHYDAGLIAQAREEFARLDQMLDLHPEQDNDLLRKKAQLYLARCAVQLGLPEGEKLIQDFIRSNQPDPLAQEALIDLADYYFQEKNYTEAIANYTEADKGNLSQEQRANLKFRLGYSYFVSKQFDKARDLLIQVRAVRNDNYAATNYYLGLCYFFEGKYPEAAAALAAVEASPRYSPYVPYYLAQIYFAQAQYQNLITYATPKLQQKGLKNSKEINQLVGQSYFELKAFDQALPYLETYANLSGTLREEEFYQLGYVQYLAGKYPDAIRNLRELSGITTPTGQFAMYYLAGCYLKIGDKTSARSAFGYAKRLDYDPIIREDALFSYAKLSYELNDPTEAIASLQELQPASPYYGEAQDLMAKIFLSYRNYKQAMEVIEQLPVKTPAIQRSYQQVVYLRGLQLYQESKYDEAGKHFELSLQYPIDAGTKALATYWLADIAHLKADYNKSIKYANEFLTLAKTVSNLPDEASLFTGNYLQGYNYLKLDNYSPAYIYFKETVDGIKRNASFLRNPEITGTMLGDATLRAGDCLFKQNKYNESIGFYEEAIARRYTGYEYAYFQKALIEGLRGRVTEKILALEQLISSFPKSTYADDALFALGATYQEIGQLSKAVPPLLRLIESYRTSTDLMNPALMKLGLIQYNLGDLEKAITYYKQVFSNNPDTEESGLALAALEEIYVDDLGQADAYFSFLETIPGYRVDNFAKDSISYQVAETQFENGNYERAVLSFSEYLRKFPNGRFALEATYFRGESHAVMQEYSEALPDYIAVSQKGASRYYQKALQKAAVIAYNHEEDFETAYSLYQQLEAAATSEDQRFDAQLGAMQSAYRSGNTGAVTTLANKVSMHPNALPIHKATASFFMGKIAFDQKNYDEALFLMNEVIRLSDNEQTAEARYLKAYIYYLRRDLETAKSLCINSNTESSAYPRWVAKSVILLSDILAESGDLTNARAALEALLENYTEDPAIISEARSKLLRLENQMKAASRLNLNINSSSLLEMEEEKPRIPVKNNNNL